jgi:hypothetical protein
MRSVLSDSFLLGSPGLPVACGSGTMFIFEIPDRPSFNILFLADVTFAANSCGVEASVLRFDGDSISSSLCPSSSAPGSISMASLSPL